MNINFLFDIRLPIFRTKHWTDGDKINRKARVKLINYERNQ